MKSSSTYFLKSATLFIGLCVYGFLLQAQTKEQRRYEIDVKREGIEFTSKDALPRGREFKRIDSTYYVGWLLEGTYKYEHAADYLGFKMAGEQLQRACNLMLNDCKPQLKKRTTNVFEFIKNMKVHKDWDYAVYCLMNCYSNTDEYEKLWNLLQTCKKLDLQDEMYLETFNYLAWTVHRNRFYTSSKYSFLKNSIKENEAYANALLDSSAIKIKRDGFLNKTILNSDYESNKMPGVWHYKSILYSYQLNIESAGFYYEKLRNTVYFPANNYATFCAIQAKFAEAEHYYNLAKEDEQTDKRMKESYYYSSILQAYKNNNKKSIDELSELIKTNGSTPGFGWYNLALARNFIYSGQNELAKRYALRAEQFKEIHIGTTLGQSHYDFTSALLNLIIKIREIESIKYLHKNWWYSPTSLSAIAQKTAEKYSLQFLIMNQFASNPERDNVVYKLFSTESTISFDEVWYLIDGFSTNFFLEKFTKELETEKRFNVKRYLKYFIAKLLIKKGKYNEANQYLESIEREILLDKDYEKLLLGRVYEALAISKNNIAENEMHLYENYPSLIPYSSLAFPIRLHSNEQTTDEQKIINTLKQCNFHWVSDVSEIALDVYITFSTKGNSHIINYYTKCNSKVYNTKTISFTSSTTEQIANELCFAIFNIEKNETPIKK